MIRSQAHGHTSIGSARLPSGCCPAQDKPGHGELRPAPATHHLSMGSDACPATSSVAETGLLASAWVNTGSPTGAGSSVRLSMIVTGLGANALYHWRLRTASDSPFFPQSPWFTLPYNLITEADVRTAGGSVDAVEDLGAGAIHPLGRVSPNPIVSSAGLSYSLPKRGRVRIGVEDVAGREVAVLVGSGRGYRIASDALGRNGRARGAASSGGVLHSVGVRGPRGSTESRTGAVTLPPEGGGSR
jgi:hypothetical protein